ncbi:MAG TPA: hypothetical protein VMM78_15855 [Thermomicrobiales bacterium]|nr:hypothetical protein [Thermomicrobiales bacterium]
MTRRSVLPWTLWALGTTLHLLGQGLGLAAGDNLPPLDPAQRLIGLVGPVAILSVGALIASRQPDNTIGWLFCFFGLALGVAWAGDAYASYSQSTHSLPAAEWVGWVGSWLSLPALFALVYLILLFPTGHLLSHRWKPIAWMAGATIIVVAIDGAFAAGEILDESNSAPNPAHIPLVESVFDVAGAVLRGILPAALVLASLLSLILRFRRSRGVERLQLKWFTYTVGVFLISFVIAGMTATLDPANDGGWLGTVAWMTALTVVIVGIPVTVGVAILRHRLYEIDRIINRTVVYGALTVSLALTYIGIIFSLGAVARSLVGESSSLVTAVSTLAVAALFLPLRARIQSAVDRRFYRHKYDAAYTIEQFSTRLRDEVHLDELTRELQEVVGRTMQPAHVSLWLRPHVPDRAHR